MNQIELQKNLIDVSSKVRVAGILAEKIETPLDQFITDQPELESMSKTMISDLSRQVKEIQEIVDKAIEKNN